MLNDNELTAALAASPSPNRVTADYIKERIAKTEFIRTGETVTICSITLDNGFSVRGESACADPANYNQEIGERVAYDQAFGNLWPLFGFLIREKQFLSADWESRK